MGGKEPLPIERLALLTAHGFDVQYILTGVRSTNLNQVGQQANPPPDSLDARIARLRNTQQDVIKALLEEMEGLNRREGEIAEREALIRELAQKTNMGRK